MAWFVLARLLFVGGRRLFGVPAAAAGGRSVVNTVFGVVLGAVIVALRDSAASNTSVTHMLGALIGGAIGLLAAKTIGPALYWADLGDERVVFLHSMILLTLPYLGLVIGGRKGEWLQPENLVVAVPHRRRAPALQDPRHQRHHRRPHRRHLRDRLHGRHAGHPAVRAEGAAAGRRLVGLDEAQPRPPRPRHPAEDPEDGRRRRARSPTLDFPDVREVDLKLIELALALQGKIVTNDFNLNKVAQLRGVEVLNINELANSLKPVVLPGEMMKVFILKEGKEYNQGVAYLDDGTMVVVDNARKMIGKTIDVVVTSVLQTTAGKMIFGRFIDAAGRGPAGAGGGSAAPPELGGRREVVACPSPPRPLSPLPPSLAPSSLVADGLLSDPRDQRLHRSSSARCRWRRACSTAAATSRTGARAPGRG